jgi:hypothetical protein
VVAAVVAALVVPFWLLWGWKGTPQSQAFVHTPQFVLWVLLFAGQAAVWVGAAGWVVSTIRRRVRDLRRLGSLPRGTAAAIIGATIVLALGAIALVFGPQAGLFGHFRPGHLPHAEMQCSPSGCTEGWPLTHHERKVIPLVGIPLVIGFLAIAGMWLAAVGLEDLAHRARARVSHARRFVALRSELTTLLAVAGVLIGFATLTAGALREAVLAAKDTDFFHERAVTCLVQRINQDNAERTPDKLVPSDRPSVRASFDNLIVSYPKCTPPLEFDRQYVLAYGLLFSGLLAIAFAPSFLAMRKAGVRLRDATYPLPQPHDPEFFQAVENRSKLDDLLQTNLSATATFKAAVAIFTPLAASLTSTLLSG